MEVEIKEGGVIRWDFQTTVSTLLFTLSEMGCQYKHVNPRDDVFFH